MITKEEKYFLEHTAYELRRLSVLATTQAGSGHPTSCLSAADIVSVLFFHSMKFDLNNHNNPDNDRFILSKGHAAPLLYAVWECLGVIDYETLLTLRKFGSPLEGHPVLKFPQSEAATGSLGQGLSIGVGMAYAARMDERLYQTYVLMGDSEIAEGSVWEAAEIAGYYKLSNLVAIVDCNRWGQSTEVMSDSDMLSYSHKFKAFGWHAVVVNGHDISELVVALDSIQNVKDRPSVIIAKTVKGYGLTSIENRNGFHGKAFSHDELPALLQELKTRFKDVVNPSTYEWKSRNPHNKNFAKQYETGIIKPASYVRGAMVATRKAYGEALAALGDVQHEVVSLDAEVKNSTYADIFEKQHPKRFVQCFIAEQNMVGMAVGMAARGKIPFVSTFGAFFTRAYDQIRMAAIGQSPLRLVGSHAGVSIGEDGPSQMALEDIAMMRAVPNSAIVYPCDAVSTYKLVNTMGQRSEGITYLRTTRMATPVLYNDSEQFPLGGCKIIKQSDNDVACIIAAGITVHEAIKAHATLQKKGISVSIIDLYSVKPFDEMTVRAVAQKSGNTIITVEDHYIQGGIGQMIAAALCNDEIMVANLAVTQLACSGTPEQLMQFMKIDAAAIVEAVSNLE